VKATENPLYLASSLLVDKIEEMLPQGPYHDFIYPSL
jgi:hypothetical protein